LSQAFFQLLHLNVFFNVFTSTNSLMVIYGVEH